MRKHDAFVDFTVDVAHAALDLGMELIIENPAPRNDPRLASYWPERAHLPQLWDMRRVRELRQQRSLTLMVVPQCAFGPGPHGLLFQKYTGLLLSRGAAARLADLRHVRCNHAKHDAVACGDDAPRAAAYPAALNDALLWGLTGVRRVAPLPGTTPPADTPEMPHPRVAPPFDRDISTGRIADGPRLSAPIRAAVDAARSKRKRWASHRNLVPASEAELRAATMPDLLPHAGATAWPGPPSQPGAAARLDEFRRALGGRSVRIGDLWEPAEYSRTRISTYQNLRVLSAHTRRAPARSSTCPHGWSAKRCSTRAESAGDRPGLGRRRSDPSVAPRRLALHMLRQHRSVPPHARASQRSAQRRQLQQWSRKGEGAAINGASAP